METETFVVRRPFIWDGKSYKNGDSIILPKDHPRLPGMLQGHFITYDKVPQPTDSGEKTESKKSTQPIVLPPEVAALSVEEE